MVAEAVDAGTSVRALVLDRLEYALAHRVDLEQAIPETVAWVLGEGLAEELFSEAGESWLRSLWTDRQRSSRKAALTGSARRHDLAPLQDAKSIFQSLYFVDGRWRPLGSLNVADIEWLEYEYRDRAAEHLKYADFFATVKKRIEGGQIVSEVFSEEELRQLFEKA